MVKLRYVLFGLCFFLLLPGIEMYLLRKLNLVHTFEDVSKTVDYEFYGKITNINTKGRGMCINIENNVNIITNAFVTIEGEMKINDSIVKKRGTDYVYYYVQLNDYNLLDSFYYSYLVYGTCP
ncbi:MAG: hypothetical protein IPN09_03665 [Bacteroidetes bacterium]|jgi:hypothetical protein|nr:hypothetical protein [Bacteroidota bacterium]